MRLIDADALKKAVDEEICNFELPISANEIMPIIDNAPTVETNCKHCDSGYAQGHSDGYLIPIKGGRQ